jgi:hypothetical protein
LWEVTGKDGAHGWLFGRSTRCRTGPSGETPGGLGRRGAGVLVVEVANLGDPRPRPRRIARCHRPRLAAAAASACPPADRPSLAAALERPGLDAAPFATTDSWAAACEIASAARRATSRERGRPSRCSRAGCRWSGSRGYAEQFAIFDRLAARDQAVLLAESRARGRPRREERRPSLARRRPRGARERNGGGHPADPELRRRCLTARNRAWSGAESRGLLAQGRRAVRGASVRGTCSGAKGCRRCSPREATR